TAAIADILHDERQTPLPIGRQYQPALDGMATKAGERYVEDLDELQRRLGRHHADLATNGASLGDGRTPELGKVDWRHHRALIGVYRGMSEIWKWHVLAGPPECRGNLHRPLAADQSCEQFAQLLAQHSVAVESDSFKR